MLAVKGNQETLPEDVETMCNYERPAAEDTDVDKGHGRIEVRLCHVFEPDAIINTYIRNHWEVENKLHWTLDMTFREDQQRKRCKMAAQNFSLVRKFALNTLKKDKSKLSLVNKRLKAAWNWGYLMQLLQI